MPSLRSRAALAALDALALVFGLAAVAIADYGGGVVHFASVRLSILHPDRPLAAAALVLAIRFALFGRRGPFGRSFGQLVRELGAREDPAARTRAPLPAARELALAALGIAAVLAVVFHAQVANLYGVPDLGDPLFSMWRMSWVSHQIIADPRHLFDANIFYPDPAALTYSDSIILPSLTAAPLLWLGVHPAVAYTLLFHSGFLLSGVAVYALARVLGFGVPGAWVGAVLFCLSPYRIAHYSHLELQMAQWMPLALLAADRLLTTGRMRYGVFLGLAIAAQWYSSMYYGMFLMIFTAAYALVLAISWRSAVRFGLTLAGMALGFAIAIPLVLVYLSAGTGRGTRTIAAIKTFSAEPRDYLQPNRRSAAYGWVRPREPNAERDLFPGLAPVVLAAAGAIPPLGATRLAILAAGIVAFDGSLGLNGHWYPLAFSALRPLQSLRVPARFTILVGLALALLSAAGVDRLGRRLPDGPVRHAALGLLTALMIADAWPVLELTPVWKRPPGIYGSLTAGSSAVLFEYPVRDNPDWFEENIPYMYFSIWHWTPMVNGYSGFLPPRYSELVAGIQGFPRGASVEYLERAGVTHVTLNCALWPVAAENPRVSILPESCEAVARRLDDDPRFRQVASASWQGQPVRLYALAR